jgi:hypothetical protein
MEELLRDGRVDLKHADSRIEIPGLHTSKEHRDNKAVKILDEHVHDLLGEEDHGPAREQDVVGSDADAELGGDPSATEATNEHER